MPTAREGRIREIPEHCEGDFLNTYRFWLRLLFRDGSSYEAFRASKDNLMQFINIRAKPKGKRGDQKEKPLQANEWAILDHF
jgi:hypothetical protein